MRRKEGGKENVLTLDRKKNKRELEEARLHCSWVYHYVAFFLSFHRSKTEISLKKASLFVLHQALLFFAFILQISREASVSLSWESSIQSSEKSCIERRNKTKTKSCETSDSCCYKYRGYMSKLALIYQHIVKYIAREASLGLPLAPIPK